MHRKVLTQTLLDKRALRGSRIKPLGTEELFLDSRNLGLFWVAFDEMVVV